MQSDRQRNLPLIIGHRGASREAPENTLESLRLAWKAGADGIEADFRLTADERIICMHDATTMRTAGIPLNVADSPLHDLQRLDAGSWKGSAWAGTKIPTLDDIVAEMPKNSWFFIELKCGPEIVAPLRKLLLTSGISPERIRLLSFNAQLLTLCRQRLPDWQSCLLIDLRRRSLRNSSRPSRADLLASLRSSGADGLASADCASLDYGLVEAVHGLGKEIHAWTVDRLPAARRLCALGVDSIMTNRPDWLRTHLKESSAP